MIFKKPHPHRCSAIVEKQQGEKITRPDLIVSRDTTRYQFPASHVYPSNLGLQFEVRNLSGESVQITNVLSFKVNAKNQNQN